MQKFACPCCGFLTLDERGAYDICPVCFWEDDAYIAVNDGKIVAARMIGGVGDDQLIDVPSGANNGLTLREGRENYKKFGACEQSMKKHVRKPRKSEFPDKRAVNSAEVNSNER